jgi:hypothetical protein
MVSCGPRNESIRSATRPWDRALRQLATGIISVTGQHFQNDRIGCNNAAMQSSEIEGCTKRCVVKSEVSMESAGPASTSPETTLGDIR